MGNVALPHFESGGTFRDYDGFLDADALRRTACYHSRTVIYTLHCIPPMVKMPFVCFANVNARSVLRRRFGHQVRCCLGGSRLSDPGELVLGTRCSHTRSLADSIPTVAYVRVCSPRAQLLHTYECSPRVRLLNRPLSATGAGVAHTAYFSDRCRWGDLHL